MQSDPKTLEQDALALIKAAEDLSALDKVRVAYLGKKGSLTQLLKQISSVSPEQRRAFGQSVNEVKTSLTHELEQAKIALSEKALSEQLAHETIDVSLPPLGQHKGTRHPVRQTQAFIESFFTRMGFDVVKGPEVEEEYYNFEALNIPATHPARAMHDTFYFEDGHLLRTHTSPVQIRTMMTERPPLRLIAPGKVYRCDSDVTHTPMFHQIEGLYIDKDVDFVHLKTTITAFLRYFFEDDNIGLRFRPSYFPFTEPSAEVDVSCIICSGKRTNCRVCKETGWLEVLGCGMIHPNVLNEVGVDSDNYVGWAFGIGLDRLAMLRYGINDLRLFFDSDLRFLKQF